jgi:molybdopterin-guanine dinucleotide biosynthesis protein A
MTEQFGGIILAGGKSSRMGTDKGLMEYNGKLLVEYAIDLLRPFCAEIIISSNNSDYERLGLKVVPDIFRDCGPVGGLHAALSGSHFNYNIVVSCDTPFVVAELFDLLLAQKKGVDIVLPEHKRGMEPLIGVYRKEVASFFEVKLIEKDFKMQDVVHACNNRKVAVDELIVKYPNLFKNLNSKNDL